VAEPVDNHRGLNREGSYAAAIYGSILATGLVGALREYHATAGAIAVALISTTAVFWLAHVWSAMLGERIETGTGGGWARIRRLAAEEWPMLESGALPFLALVLAETGLYSDKAGVNAAVVLGVAQLVGWGILGARRMTVTWPKALAIGVIEGAFGLAIVGLEIAVH
jgi:hypothetical protein